MMSNKHMREAICFAGGVLFGTAGIKLLSSKDAKKMYVNVAAAVLRMRSCVLDVFEQVQENAADVLAEAEAINAERTAAEKAQEMEAMAEAETEA